MIVLGWLASPGMSATDGHGTPGCPHSANHGGRFSAALNDAYHVEGSYPEPGLFRMHIYDAESCPLSPKPFAGEVMLTSGTRIRLSASEDGTHLIARIPGNPPPPASLTVLLSLPHPKTGSPVVEHFSYNFHRLSRPASAKTTSATLTH